MINFRRLIWVIFPSFLGITLASVAVVSWHAARSMKTFFHRRTADDLTDRARLAAAALRGPLATSDRDAIDARCKQLGKESHMRLTVVATDGTVLGDSDEQPANMENHLSRPEIIAAKSSPDGVGAARRVSDTLKQELFYVAVAVRDGDRLLGFVRAAIPTAPLDAEVFGMLQRIGFVAGLVGVAAAAISLWLSRRLVRPLEELRRGAERFSQGDLKHRVRGDFSLEIAAVADAMNQMAAALDARIRELIQQRNEGQAVLSSMVEGVIAVDSQQRIISMNQACARLLSTDAARAAGRSLQEVVRNPDLQQLVAGVLIGQKPLSQEIQLHQQGERQIEAHASVLRDAADREIGVLLVLHDVTRLRKLENMRRDFVANVSHELRTPITSIKGFVETLLDGAVENPEDAKRFLQIVAAQTDRLEAIIEDLLLLSRVEEEHEHSEPTLEIGNIQSIIEAAVSVCRLKADEKQIHLDIACDPSLRAEINPTLLEQALVNLIDNAVKYSNEGQTVHIEAELMPDELQIRVRDHGCGIPREHLPRIFERFYRVDKARSRSLGGTGLGLAIVKHIAQYHRGRATVESTLGKGSTFVLHLPRIDSAGPQMPPEA